MRTVLASLICLLLTVAPLAAFDTAPLPGDSAAETCCGHCPASDSAAAMTAGHTCCSAPGDEAPASSRPCDSDCGECPCCTVTAPPLLAILFPEGQMLGPAHSFGFLASNDRLSSRCDEPLLPPPRG